MKVKLMNSAMMPCEGHYRLKKIDRITFVKLLKQAHEAGTLESYIGYQDNIYFIKKWSGISVPFSRANTLLDDGDCLLVMKLNKRIKDPAMKGKDKMAEGDYEFYLCTYNKV